MQLENLHKKILSSKTSLQGLGNELEDAGVSTRNLADESAKLTRQIEKAEQAQRHYARAAERTEKSLRISSSR